MRNLLIQLATLLVTTVTAQPMLLPGIGLEALPADMELVCPLPFQTPPITSTGFFVGDTAADFRLYDRDGNAFHLGSTLAAGKPVLMIAGSWTCPVYRNKLWHINDMMALYGDQVEFIIVYTVEAHPIIDISPYFGAVNPGQSNLGAGITYQQPTTYGERKAMVDVMLDSMVVAPPVYIDGPCNAWWDHYGPAPNNAYLIGTDGIIAVKHGWYNKFPDDIECDIREHLGLPTDCDGGTFLGSFTMSPVTNDTVYGPVGTTLTASALLHNPTQYDVQLRVVRLQDNVPSGWTGSLCMDVCYLPQVDTAFIVIPAGQTQDFHYYYYTTGTPATGHVRIGFRNENDLSNTVIRNYWAVAEEATGLGQYAVQTVPWTVHPNPTQGSLRIVTDTHYDGMLLMDAFGRMVQRLPRGSADLHGMAPGVYFLRLTDQGAVLPGVLRVVLQ